jgi:hypothetical protein
VADDREPGFAAVIASRSRNVIAPEPRRHVVTSFFFFVTFAVFVSSWSVYAQSGKPVTYKGLEISVAGVERAATASLKDCPPGGNTVNATTRPGEEFAIVKINFKVTSAFQPNTMLKRPTLTDDAGKTYNTAVSFVDVGSVPEFSCAIPFRVPTGTALKAVHVDTATIDIPASASKP